MNRSFAYLILFVSALEIRANPFQISSFNHEKMIHWSGGFPQGVCTVEAAINIDGPWHWQQNRFTTNTEGEINAILSRSSRFFRLLEVDLSTNTPNSFKNLTTSYGVIETIAGSGQGGLDGTNYWKASYEGGQATAAALSRPHVAMSDQAGNIFIVDKDSHSVLKVSPDGLIHTVLGTHSSGNGGDTSLSGASVALNSPNGLWVGSNGIIYVLDTGNGKVRRLGTDGMVSTLFHEKNGITGGRGLWVKEDESIVYFVNGPNIRRWTPSGGFHTINNKSFVDPGNLVVDSDNNLVVTDRGGNRVYRLNADGSRDPIAGNGSSNPIVDDRPALNNGLYGVRGIWFLPNKGYLLATHEGSQILYVDPAGVLHVLVNGSPGNTHAGDGQWFYGQTPKIAEARSVSLDNAGNILIVENDVGYVRRIRFQRLGP